MRSRSEYQERDLFIDALRVLAVLIVVVGHWVTTTVIWEEGRISVENALSVIPESHVATWLLQVMPLLFFVGGFSNARSLSRHDGAYLAYLRTRLVRLLAPTLVFMSVWLLVGIVAEALPLREPNPLGRAADLAALPFWFLGMYVVVVALAPRLWQLHQRLGWWVPALFFAGAAIVDVLVYGFGYTAVGVANYAFVWLAVHQLGYAWRDGHMAGVRQGLTWVVSGALILAGLITLGPYPVSMVSVPGEAVSNTLPPKLPLLALGRGRLPKGMQPSHVVGVGLLGGMGFTMSIFITGLGFGDQPEQLLIAKTGILTASLIAGLGGYLWLRLGGQAQLNR